MDIYRYLSRHQNSKPTKFYTRDKPNITNPNHCFISQWQSNVRYKESTNQILKNICL